MATNKQPSSQPLVEGFDYYIEAGCLVFTAAYHLRRGHCCNSGCRHCPYSNEAIEKQMPPQKPTKSDE